MSNVRGFGAAGDGNTDDTDAFRHALKDGNGVLELPPGDYLISRTIVVELEAAGRFGLRGESGTAKVIMAGAGPAFHLVGTHGGTALPESVKAPVWSHERMPTLLNVEIEGRHAEAAGIWIEGAMQATLEGVLLRRLQDGVRVLRRARNLLISHCHIYNNRRYGVHFDHVNLHQAIIAGSHISYNRQAGVIIEGGEVRNVQITGNDIEYNFDPGLEGCADVLFDCSPEGSSINEGTIAGNTVQAVPSPGGANVRLIGSQDQPHNSAGMLSISGNLIGSQETNVHLVRTCSTVLSGNMIYAGTRRNVLVENSRNIVIGANSIDHNTDLSETRQIATGIRIENTSDLSLTGVQIKNAPAGKHVGADVPAVERQGLVELVGCRRVTASGLHLVDGTPHGLYAESCSDVLITGSTILEAREERQAQSAVRFEGAGKGNFLSACRLTGGAKGAVEADEKAGLEASGNMVA